MRSDTSESDSFDDLPRSRKRRKIQNDPSEAKKHSATSADKLDSPQDENCDPAIDKIDSDDDGELPVRKPKHRVHIPETRCELVDTFVSQIPIDLSSSPDRIRGPIWLKKIPSPEPQRTEVSAYTAMMKSNTPVSRKPPAAAASTVQTKTPEAGTAPAPVIDFAAELADLPSDAFESSDASPTKPIELDDGASSPEAFSGPPRPAKTTAPTKGLRQATLHGGTVQAANSVSQKTKKAAWPMAAKDEPPTHHKLNTDAMATWVYPTNLGTIRDYQYTIVSIALYHNLLVALPTGLGKTFIAATVMLNWFRWTKDAQIVFVAPTKPLVSQQIEACFHVVGIPRSETVMLTGSVEPGLRAEQWLTKRVFFMTPQTIINDLKTGICDPKRIVLLVVDEAHRATGNYAYVEVVKFLRRFNSSFRVLALTATPGAKVESVQQVIDGLDIARTEIRTEISLDIRQYVHQRDVQTEVFDYSEEQDMVMELFAKAIKPVLDKLNSQNVYWVKDPLRITAFGLTQATRQYQGSEAGKKANWGLKQMIMSMSSTLASLAHTLGLLKFHGMGPFFRGCVAFREGKEKATSGKYAVQIRENENFQKMMNRIEAWIKNPDFIGHPKLEYLRSVVLNHFMDAGEGGTGIAPSATRVMVFVHFRDSAEEVCRILRRNEPMIRPHVFVGQAESKGSAGMDQKKQLEVIQQFKDGKYNTLVATSIGEEGLDIGEVDLIICYDASASPIRMLQRMGRTGRKRKGKICLLLMRDKEERDSKMANDNYEAMQTMITAGDRFTYHEDRSPRILPKEIKPAVDKRVVEIPVENSQADLPEPKKTGRRAPKRPPKKFHMPDNVRTGFVQASRMESDDSEASEAQEKPAPKKAKKMKAKAGTSTTRTKRTKLPAEIEIVQLPFLNDVLLNKVQERELARKYQYVSETNANGTVSAPDLDKYPHALRRLGPTKLLKHGRATREMEATLRRMRRVDDRRLATLKGNLQRSDVNTDVHGLVDDTELERIRDDAFDEGIAARTPAKAARKPKSRGRKSNRSPGLEAMEGASSSPEATPAHMRIATQGIDLGSEDTSGEDGDEEPDSQLAAFVARSDEPIELVSSSLPHFMDTQTPSKSYRVDSDEMESGRDGNDSDADLPEIPMSTKRAGGVDSASDSDLGRKGAHGAALQRRKKKKRQVVESDTDD